MRPVFIILIIIAVAFILLTIAGIIIGNTFFDVSMNRYYQKARVSKRAKNADEKHPLVSPGRDHKEEWLETVAVKKEIITSFDGLRLCALLIENPAAFCTRFVIICHGYTGHAKGMAFHAEKFYNQGFSILLPSARGHDDSEGDYIGFGWNERLDIQKWILLINEKYDHPQIVLYGESMGAATVMMTVGEQLSSNVICAIEDCGYSSIYDEFNHTLKEMVRLRLPFVLFFAYLEIKRRTGINIYKDGSSVAQLKKAKTPMLFIHGTADKYVPYDMLEKNYNAHPGSKEKLIFEGVPHASCAWDGGELYWKRVFEFINKYI